MIKTVIFDIGNVLVSWEPVSYFTKIGIDESLHNEINNATFGSKFWPEFDRGVIPEEELGPLLIANAEPHLGEHIKKIFDTDWYTILQPMPESHDFVNELKNKDYRLLILSNFHEIGYKRIFDENRVLDLFDGGIISYEVKQIKPNKEIFDLLIEKYSLVPEECLFIDDMPKNINTAKELGFHTIQFIGIEDCKKRFAKMVD